jgi:hypothetical protein
VLSLSHHTFSSIIDMHLSQIVVGAIVINFCSTSALYLSRRSCTSTQEYVFLVHHKSGTELSVRLAELLEAKSACRLAALSITIPRSLSRRSYVINIKFMSSVALKGLDT